MAPIVWIIGGIAAAIGTAIATSHGEDDSYEASDDFAARMAAAREKARREREARNRRRMARINEASENLSSVRARHRSRIASAKSKAARSRAHLEEVVAVERGLNDLLK